MCDSVLFSIWCFSHRLNVCFQVANQVVRDRKVIAFICLLYQTMIYLSQCQKVN